MRNIRKIKIEIENQSVNLREYQYSETQTRGICDSHTVAECLFVKAERTEQTRIAAIFPVRVAFSWKGGNQSVSFHLSQND